MEIKHAANKIKEYQGGYKNQEDIWDLSSWEDVKKEVESFPPRTNIFLDSRHTNYERLPVIQKFLNELSETLKEVFLEELEFRIGKKRAISPELIKALIEKEIIFPRLSILTGFHARRLLHELGFSSHIGEGEFLFVFNFPLPVARFWWRYSHELEDEEKVDWGDIYEIMLDVFWDIVDQYRDLIDFERINDYGEHDAEKYYYLFYLK